jgi:hypothetical protein
MRSFWLSSKKMTVGVDTNRKGIIIESAPIVKVFRGQHINKLIKWMKKQGGFKAKELTPA